MKKLSILLAFSFLIPTATMAHPRYYCPHHYPHYYNSYYSSSYVYLVRSDDFQEEQSFKDCLEHTLLINGTTNYYSNGTRRTYYSYTILNKDKTPLIENCSNIQHITYNKKHYFLAT